MWLLTTVLLGVDRAEVSSLKIWWNGSRRGNREFKGFHHLPSLLPSTLGPKSFTDLILIHIYHHAKGQLFSKQNCLVITSPKKRTKCTQQTNVRSFFGRSYDLTTLFRDLLTFTRRHSETIGRRLKSCDLLCMTKILQDQKWLYDSPI